MPAIPAILNDTRTKESLLNSVSDSIHTGAHWSSPVSGLRHITASFIPATILHSDFLSVLYVTVFCGQFFFLPFLPLVWLKRVGFEAQAARGQTL